MAKTQRAGQHHVAGRRLAILPQRDRPGEQPGRHQGRDHGVQNAQPLQIIETAPPRVHLAVDDRVKAGVLAPTAPEGIDQRHVADDVDHLAVDRGGLIGEIVVQRATRRGETKHQPAP